MKIIEAKCPKCKEIIKVDADSDSTKCEFCKEKIDVKDALLEKMLDESSTKKDKKPNKKKVEEKQQEEIEEVEEEVKASKPEKRKEYTKAGFNEELSKAEKYFNNKSFADAATCYQSALNINSKDKYCKFMYYYSLFRANRLDLDSLKAAYEEMFELDYYIDGYGEKNFQVVDFQEEFISVVYRQAYTMHESIKGHTVAKLERVKSYFNAWYTYLYLFECLNSEDLDNQFKEKTLVFIIKIIDYLSETYYCGENGKTRFKDVSNLDTLKEKKTKYINQLKSINANYTESISRINKEIIRTANTIKKDKFNSLSFKEKFMELYNKNKFFRFIFLFIVLILIIFLKVLADA